MTQKPPHISNLFTNFIDILLNSKIFMLSTSFITFLPKKQYNKIKC